MVGAAQPARFYSQHPVVVGDPGHRKGPRDQVPSPFEDQASHARLHLLILTRPAFNVSDDSGRSDASRRLGATGSARRTFFGEKMATMDPEVFPLLLGAFAGPETIPADLVNSSILDRIRSA